MPEEEMEVFKHNNYNIYYSKVQIQDMDSILCGYFCIGFLFCVNRLMGSILNRIKAFQKKFNFNNQVNNDKILISFINSTYK